MVSGLVWQLSDHICYKSGGAIIRLVPGATRRQLVQLRPVLPVGWARQPQPWQPQRRHRPAPFEDALVTICYFTFLQFAKKVKQKPYNEGHRSFQWHAGGASARRKACHWNDRWPTKKTKPNSKEASLCEAADANFENGCNIMFILLLCYRWLLGLDHRFGHFLAIALWCPFGNRAWLIDLWLIHNPAC